MVISRLLKPKNVLPKLEWIYVRFQPHHTIKIIIKKIIIMIVIIIIVIIIINKKQYIFKWDSHRNVRYLSDNERLVWNIFLFKLNKLNLD